MAIGGVMSTVIAFFLALTENADMQVLSSTDVCATENALSSELVAMLRAAYITTNCSWDNVTLSDVLG